MKKIIFFLSLCIPLFLYSQTNPLVKELERRRSMLFKQIKESESLFQTAKKNTESELSSLATLTGQISERRRLLTMLQNDVALLDNEIKLVQRELAELKEQLLEKKEKYANSVRYMHRNRSLQSKLLFIFSAETFEQSYRRLRYVNEYASYQKLKGGEIEEKQTQVKRKQQELLQTREAKEILLKEHRQANAALENQEKLKRKLVQQLKSKQGDIQREIAKKKREQQKLNAEIERLIAEEIEKANRAAQKESVEEGTSITPMGKFSLNKADAQLSTNFSSNRGKLPLPITGPFIIVSRYGEYAVEGLRNVRLDNKGIDIQGQPGAMARSIFNGKVAAVFELNGLFNILIRHGNYISVYCNLVKPLVKTGDVVKTKDVLGEIHSDSSDNHRTILHFQLRKEREKLNPEAWLNR